MMNGDVPLGTELVDEFLDRAWGDDFVRFALDDDTRRRAGREEAEIVHVGRRRDRDEAADLGAAHEQLHSDPGAEAHSGYPGGLGLRVDRLDPVERTCRVGQFTDAIVEHALALADAAEVETQGRETALHKGLVEELNDLVVHRPAGLRVGMQDQRDRRSRTRSGMETSFKAAFGAWENDFGHESGVTRD